MILLVCIVTAVVVGLLAVFGWLLYDFMKYKKKDSTCNFS